MHILQNLYAICDLCLSITKLLARNKEDVHESVIPVSLPEVLYAPQVNNKHENKEEIKEDDKIEDEIKQEIKEDEKIEEKKENTEEDEKKQEIDTEVAEGQTWLAEENALAYLESLILEANGDNGDVCSYSLFSSN
ncbi:hypothetical protein L1987_40047 [Smallanthus sonchifolius]|uniref:Uncharacterized protein n=1 Tax=Smallanthus sonchifolius TaxID=185202 RepID=A0ACB9GTP6_9ASTR|nr:hypothetical protein L1987_40047 [Smallanthus sonchifolius]